jgi:hypothetical protein
MNVLLEQRIRREIATLEWVTACANRELREFGEWQCAWAAYQCETQQNLDRLFSLVSSERLLEQGLSRTNETLEFES